MHALRPYRSYRESGIHWLSEVPEHWEVLPGRACFLEKKQSNAGHKEQTVLSLSYGKIVVKPREKLHGLVPSSFETYQIINPLDIVIRPTDLQNDQSSLRFGLSSHRGIITSAYLCFEAKDRIEPNFGYLLLHSYDLMKIFYGMGSGLRQNLDWEDFKSLPCFVPPITEQTKIVRFLDHADRRIRRYIRAKEKLIALLEEQKQTIIHQAVTGRVDVRTGQPYPDYKPSGIEWLGDVPAHWQVLRLGRVINLKVGFPFKSDDFTQSEEDMRLLRGINVASGQLRWDEVVRWPADDVDTFSEYKIEVGDIILGMDRPIISSGIRVAVASESDVPSLLLQRVACIRPDPESLVRKFVFWILGSNNFVNYLSPIFTGISVPHLSAEQIKEFWISLPDIAEQEVIITYLASRLSAIQSATERAQRQIDLFREFRTRLITDVVTGKLDVREAADALPEEPDDPDAVECDCAGTEESDGDRPARDRRTEVLAIQEEMIA